MTVRTTAQSSSHPASRPAPALSLLFGNNPLPRSLPHFIFASEAAKAFHESLYRQKLATLLEKKKLSEEDDGELRKMQVG